MKRCLKCRGDGCKVCNNIGFVPTNTDEDIRVQIACLREEVAEIKQQLKQ